MSAAADLRGSPAAPTLGYPAFARTRNPVIASLAPEGGALRPGRVLTVRHVLEEYPRARRPGHVRAQNRGILRVSIPAHRGMRGADPHRARQPALSDHVARRRSGKCSNRHAARQCLQQHEPEGVGAARKHEDVGRSVDFGQRLAVPRPEKHRLRKFPRQRRRAPARRRRPLWCRADRARGTLRGFSRPPAGRPSEISAAEN